jgi:hypothetical protein
MRWQEQQHAQKAQQKAERRRKLSSLFSFFRFERTPAQNRVLPVEGSAATDSSSSTGGGVR